VALLLIARLFELFFGCAAAGALGISAPSHTVLAGIPKEKPAMGFAANSASGQNLRFQ